MLDLVIDECLPDRQVSPEIPERVLSNSKAEAYLCVDEFCRAALEPCRGVKVRWEEKGNLECCEIQGGMRTVLLFREIGLC